MVPHEVLKVIDENRQRYVDELLHFLSHSQRQHLFRACF